MIYLSSLNPCLTRKIDYDVNYRRHPVQYLVVQGLDAWFGTEKGMAENVKYDLKHAVN